jgi:hypothetical protein
MIRVSTSAEDTVSTVSSVGAARNNGSGGINRRGKSVQTTGTTFAVGARPG